MRSIHLTLFLTILLIATKTQTWSAVPDIRTGIHTYIQGVFKSYQTPCLAVVHYQSAIILVTQKHLVGLFLAV